ncbi:MAG TPA: multidrug effflux MFS transporter [Steroidobacteraceae bacterium]
MSAAAEPDGTSDPASPAQPALTLPPRSLVALLAAITAIGPGSVNIYLPALPVLREHFATDVPHVQLTVSMALLAFSVGLLVHGPLSDRFGRRPIILMGLGIFSLGSLLCLLAPNLPWLIVARAIQAYGTSAGVIVSRAIVNDLYPREKMARMIAWLTMVTVIAPTLAPWLGGKLIMSAGWHSVFVLLLVIGVAILGAAWRWLPETRAPRPAHVEHTSVLAEAGALLRQGAFMGYSFQGAVIFAVFFVFVATMPYVMVTRFHRPPTEFGTYYLLVAGGYFLGNWRVTRHHGQAGIQGLVNSGVLISTAGAGLALAAVALGAVHPVWIFAPIALMTYGQGLTLPNVTASAISLARQHAGTSSSLLGFIQQVLGAICVQWIGAFPVDTPFPVLIFCTVTCAAAAALWFFTSPWR